MIVIDNKLDYVIPLFKITGFEYGIGACDATVAKLKQGLSTWNEFKFTQSGNGKFLSLTSKKLIDTFANWRIIIVKLPCNKKNVYHCKPEWEV